MKELIEQLKRHEGVKTHVYLCPAGFETIGVGRNISESGLGLTEDEIEYLLNNDIKRCSQELSDNFKWYLELNRARQYAMINLCFNLGLPTLLKFKNALKSMEAGLFDEAADHFLDSRWARQVGGRAVEVTSTIRTGKL
jgi:lysozyme